MGMDAVREQIERVVQFFEGREGYVRYERLLFFAHTEIARHRWCSGWRASPPGGKGAADFVNDLLRQVLQSGGPSDYRRIPPEVDVEVALRWHVRSKISAAVRSFENRHAIRYDDFEFGQHLVERAISASADDAGEAERDETSALLNSKRCQEFLDFIADDSLVHAMLLLIRDLGIEGPAERVARHLDSSIPAVYAARRRLKAALKRFRKKEANE